MKLVLDIGNTLVKAGVFEKKQLVSSKTASCLSLDSISSLVRKNKNISSVIISAVRSVPPEILNYLKKNYRFTEFSSATPLPITNLYRTAETLGKDRLAGVVAAHFLYPKKNVLVIDAGTCITYDLITKDGKYSGGSISPGLSMRFKALHTFTGKLPLVKVSNFKELVGKDTEKSILSGVINGLIAEADTIIERYKKLYPSMITVVCGGDAPFLADRLKNSIFAQPELVLIGLNEILDYNES
jgi:type III pantothenate kinase